MPSVARSEVVAMGRNRKSQNDEKIMINNVPKTITATYTHILLHYFLSLSNLSTKHHLSFNINVYYGLNGTQSF